MEGVINNQTIDYHWNLPRKSDKKNPQNTHCCYTYSDNIVKELLIYVRKCLQTLNFFREFFSYCMFLKTVSLCFPNASMFHRTTESQTGWSWKGPLEVIQSTLPLKQDRLKHVAQDHVPTDFEYL